MKKIALVIIVLLMFAGLYGVHEYRHHNYLNDYVRDAIRLSQTGEGDDTWLTESWVTDYFTTEES